MTESTPTAVATPVAVPGVVTITEKAMRRLFSAIAAEELGVPAGEVRARVSDARGRLAVHLAGPIRLAPLGATRTTTVLGVADAVRSRVARDGERLSGAGVESVRVQVTGTRIQNDRRVA
jgi:hypothetical protein